MTPDEARKLLGGFATGTLTAAEEEALYGAALEDQELFDALAREQSLRDLLRDPAAKAELLAALDGPRQSWWWSWRPAVAAVAMAGIALVAVVLVRSKAPRPVEIAQVRIAPGVVPAAPLVEPQVETPAKDLRRPVAAKKPAAQALASPAPPSAPLPAQEAPAKEMEKAELRSAAPAGVVGGVPGGVIGGIIRPEPRAPIAAPPPPPQTARPQAMFDTNAATMQAQALPSARDLFYGATLPAAATRARAAVAADMLTTRSFGVRYSVLRKQGADWVEADPDSLRADDTLALRFTPSMNAHLSLDGATPVALTAMQPYTTDAIAAEQARIIVSRTPTRADAATENVLTQRSGLDTFVVNPAGTAPFAFTITLKRQ